MRPNKFYEIFQKKKTNLIYMKTCSEYVLEYVQFTFQKSAGFK